MTTIDTRRVTAGVCADGHAMQTFDLILGGRLYESAATIHGQDIYFQPVKALVGSGSTAVGLPINLPPVPETQWVDFIRQLLPTETTLDGAFGYMKQVLRTNNAAVVPEGTRKPTSIYTWLRIDGRVDTIAHLSEPIPRQYLDDASMLRQLVDDDPRHGLDLALGAEIVAALLAEASPAGSGLGTNPLTDLLQGHHGPADRRPRPERLRDASLQL